MQRTNLNTQSNSLSIIFSFLLLILSPGFSAVIQAQVADADERKPAKLFGTSDTLKVVLTLPWQAIVSDEFFFQGTYPSNMEYTDDLGNMNSLELSTERRGMTRQVVCRYPPIRLRFQKEAVKGTTFRGQNSLKLVTHCDTGTSFKRYQILEKLAYEMYNLITDFSFRVRPLSVTYIDSEHGGIDGPRFAFFLEDDSDVAKRNGQKKLKIGEIALENLHPLESSKLSLFQYMIGNTDWSTPGGSDLEECCKNIKLIGQDPINDPVYAIPNDFDSSGFVNAHYAVPSTNLPIKSVTQRLFSGFCLHNGTLEDAKQRFLAREQDIYSLLENEDRLMDDSKETAQKYLGEFFEIMRDQEKFEKEIIANCRNHTNTDSMRRE